VIRRERPNLQIFTCHDEYLLHTMFDVDGALVGYGGIAPEPLLEMIAPARRRTTQGARDPRPLLPVTSNVYHRGSHMEGSVALKWALVARGILDHATVRSAAAAAGRRCAGRDRGRHEVGGAGPRRQVRHQEGRLTAR
jgi:4-hydroxy-tetrahydrodipicolinate synthase